ncbi:MAG: elongation factor G [Chloroflexi bacterium]|nr:elongation factor G [Chloroflexota bacterium]
MTIYKTDQIRNVVLLSHGGAGKTSLGEIMLFDSGASNRLGRVDDGNTVSDYDPEEVRRKISVQMALLPYEWNGAKVNVLDVPGYVDFVGDMLSGIQAADAAVVLVDAVSGVEVGTELVWNYADRRQLPRLAFINKMDRENADFDRALASLRENFDATFVPLQLPIGKQADFRGVVDLVTMKAYLGEKGEKAPIPDDLSEEAEEARIALVEAAAETDDALIEKYFEGEDLSPQEIIQGLQLSMQEGTMVPVLCGSALKNIGVQPLMQAIVDFAPSPAEAGTVTATNPATEAEEVLGPDAAGPLAALVFKTLADPYVGRLSYFRVYSGTLPSDSRVFNITKGEEERIGQLYMMRGREQTPVAQVVAGDIGAVTRLAETRTGDTLADKGHPLVLPATSYPYPLYEVAVSPKTQADSAKMGTTLTRLCEEDLTLRWRQEPSTRQTILAGMGDTHVNIAVQRLEERFNVGVTTAVPKVPYRETVSRSAADQYRHKKQTGGSGQFAEVHMEVRPLPRGEGFDYDTSRVFGGAISQSFFPSIEKGIKSVLERGVLAGYPIEDVRCEVYDGKEHPVDSKDIAFQVAGREAFKKVFLQASPVLLEPIMNMTITVPEEFMGDVLGDLNTRRGRVMGMEQQRGKSLVIAQAPLAEIQRYGTDLRSMTQGRGVYEIEFSHYEVMPSHVADGVIAGAKSEAESA